MNTTSSNPLKRDEEAIHKEVHKLHEKHEKDRDILAKEEPLVIDSSAADPVLPAMSEYEVDEGGWQGSTKKHPGLLWAIIAIVAVLILVAVLIGVGEWA